MAPCQDWRHFAALARATQPKMKAGFLDASAAVSPVGAAALEELFQRTIKEASRLQEVVDPEEEPYRSRYEERALLKRLSLQERLMSSHCLV
eukprot:6175197-Pleurochrysis_carterae.AAC.3